jgi:hypothetical protein
MSEEANNPKITRDIAFITGHSKAGNPLITRVQGTDEAPTRVMVGEIRPVEDGVPLAGEMIRMVQAKNGPHYHVETLVEDPYREERRRAQGSRRSFGATAKMRENWDRIFGPKPDRSEIN